MHDGSTSHDIILYLSHATGRNRASHAISQGSVISKYMIVDKVENFNVKAPALFRPTLERFGYVLDEIKTIYINGQNGRLITFISTPRLV